MKVYNGLNINEKYTVMFYYISLLYVFIDALACPETSVYTVCLGQVSCYSELANYLHVCYYCSKMLVTQLLCHFNKFTCFKKICSLILYYHNNHAS